MALHNHSTFGERQLFQYVLDGKARRVQKILEREKSIPVDIVNNKGQTLLYVSCLHERLKVVVVLLRFGADPNRRSIDGSTPTHAAAYSCSTQILRFIVEECGGDMRLHDKQMRTPKDWAITAGRSVNRKVLQLIATWEEQFSEKMTSRENDCRLSKMSKSEQILKSNLRIDYCGYGSYLQSSRAKTGGYLGIAAVLPLASPRNLESSGNLSLVFKSPPAFIMEEAFWCRHKVMIKRSRGRSLSLIEAAEDLLISEAKACRNLRHPDLLLLMAVCLTSPEESCTGTPSYWLIYEPIRVGSLYRVLHDLKNNVTPAYAAKLMIQIAEALCYLHQRGYVHCAVTSHAVYLTDNGMAKLGDLFCIHCDGDESLPIPISPCFSRWAAPEVILNGVLSSATDVYSYCVVVAEAFSGSVPWCGCDDASVQKHIKNRRNYFLLPDWLPCSLERILQNGLKFYSHNRTVAIKDISECLSSLLISGGLKSNVTAANGEEAYETSFFNHSRVTMGEFSSASLKTGSFTNERPELEATDDTYVTAGIDVPDAVPINSKDPKKALATETVTQNDTSAMELPKNFMEERPKSDRKCSREGFTDHSRQARSKPVELTRRPHSCSILTRDGLAREFLPPVRHSSFPNICGTNTPSSEPTSSLPPPYRDVVQWKCDLSARPSKTDCGMRCTMDTGACVLPFIRNNTVKKCETIMVGDAKAPFAAYEYSGGPGPSSERQNATAPSLVRSPPAKTYVPEHLSSMCSSAPRQPHHVIDSAVSDINEMLLLPDSGSTQNLQQNSKKNLDREHLRITQAKENADDVPDSCARRLVQRTTSYPGVQRPRDPKHCNTTHQMSTSALIKSRPRKSVDYADFTQEEKYNIENDDLEIIFASFAERKTSKNTHTSFETKPANFSPREPRGEHFSSKASQTDSTVEPGRIHPSHLRSHSGVHFPATEFSINSGIGNSDVIEFLMPRGALINNTHVPDLELNEPRIPATPVVGDQPGNQDEAAVPDHFKLDCESETCNLVASVDDECEENRHEKSVSSAFVTCMEKDEEDAHDGVPVESEAVIRGGNMDGSLVAKELRQDELQSIENAVDVEVATPVTQSEKDVETFSRPNGRLTKVEIVNLQDQIQEASESAFEVVVPLRNSQRLAENPQRSSSAEISGHGIAKTSDGECASQPAVLARCSSEAIGSCQERKVMPRTRFAKPRLVELHEKSETPSKWSFQKKLFLFKAVADTGENGQLGRTAMTQNAFSKVQQAVEKLEEQRTPSPRRRFEVPAEASEITREFLNGDSSVDDSCSTIHTNRLLQEKVGSTFKTSTPVSQAQPTTTHGEVECRHAVTPKSFEEVRAEIEAASTSKISRSKNEEQGESRVNDTLPDNCCSQEHNYAQTCSKKTDQCTVKCPSDGLAKRDGTASAYVEAVDDSYQDLEISRSKEREMGQLARSIVNGVIETALATLRQDFQPPDNDVDFNPASDIEKQFCVDDESCGSQAETSEQRLATPSSPDSRIIFDVPPSFAISEHPQGRKKIARSIPADLDMAGAPVNRRNRSQRPYDARKPRSYPEVVVAIDCSAEGEGQECSSFLSEDKQSSRHHRSVDTSVWSFGNE